MRKSTRLFLIPVLLIPGLFISLQAQHFSMKHLKAEPSKLPANLTASESGSNIGLKPPNVYVSSRSVLDDPSTMVTKYDLQSNAASGQQRIYLYPDGTIGAVATMSHEDGGSYNDRGTGYNYFDGSTWNAQPASRVETTRTGWPSYQPYGPTGEIVLAHQAPPNPIKFCTRPVKGTGAWTESTIANPVGATNMWWARMITNGPDHTYIHVIAVTLPSGNGGTTYNGMDGALLYTRSLDGGASWSDWIQMDGITSSEYLAISADDYAWALPKGNTLAFIVGSSWYDQFLMKSTDNGTTWTKTIIWPCPYNLWAGGDSVSTYWCPDGTSAVALDLYGNAHVIFGLQRASGDMNGGKYWVPYTDGLVYWNETLPPITSLEWDSVIANNQLIGWVKDTNVFYPPTGVKLAHYYCSMTSNPAITIDDNNNMFVIWAGVTPLLDPDNYYLRHIFERTGKVYSDFGVIWQDSLTDITSEFLQYNWTECMFPDIASNSDDNIYILFQADDLAGSYVKGLNVSGYSGQTSITENNMIFLSRAKTDLYVGTKNKNSPPPSMVVSKNYPNPVKDLTTVNVSTSLPGHPGLEVMNITGQKILEIEKPFKAAGTFRFVIDCREFTSGVYFYTIRMNGESVKGKMIVE